MEQIVQRDGLGLFTTSEIIADRTKVSHQSVLKLVDGYRTDIEEFGKVGFEIRPGYNNSQVRIAQLNEQQSTLLLSYMRNNEVVRKFKKDLVKGFYEMAQQIQELQRQEYRPPAELSRKEILTMALEAEERADGYKAELEVAAPKITYVDEFVADNDYLLFRTVASNLEVGEHALRWALVYSGWIYHESQRRRNSRGEIVTEHQWAEYSHKKPYFFRSMNHQAPLFKGNAKFTLKVTAAGASAIARLVKKIEDEFGTLGEALPELEARHNRKKAA